MLEKKRLLIVSGKGGVGKSTLAAAVALESARRGQRTLVCELNAKERVSMLLGRPEVGPEIGLLEENLWAVDIRPQEATREYALMVLKFESIYNAVFENRLVRTFLRFVPSLQEIVLLGKILYHLREQRPDGSWRFERIVVDGPATGHAVSFYGVPKVVLDTVPPGPLARESKVMLDLLTDEAITAAVLVALPEEMPVNETLELCQALRERVGVRPQAVVLNCFIPPRFGREDPSLLSLNRPLEQVAQSHLERERQSQAARERLCAGTGLPVFEVPRLFHPSFGRAAVEEISRRIARLEE